MSKYRARLFSRSVKPLFLLLRTCVFIVLVVDSDGYQEQKFAMEPQDQTAIIGSRVTLPCRVEKKSGQLQWTKDDFGLGLHRDLSGYDRYRMIGSDEEGDYSLDIREVTLDDEAKYQCQVSSGSSGEPPIRSRYAQLTVLVPPEPPKISQGETVSATEDARFDLECLSVGGKPPAEITWVDSNAGVITQGVTYSVEPMADSQRFTARSILKILASEYHHNETFTCQAQNTADRAYKSASVTLDVRYSPKIKIENRTKTIKGRIPEGENLILECNARSNPSNKTYKWYLNDEFVLAKKDLIINNITRDYNSVIAKCIVENEVGTSESTVNITVTYEPSFRTNILDYQADAGAAVILTCDVDSFPEAEIQWYHVEDGQRIVVGRTTNMSLVADARTTGKYVCRASVEGYVPIENSAYLLIKGPPKILSNDTQTGVLGEMIKIECAAIAVPRIEKIVWTFDGKEIDFLHDQDYIFQEDIQLEGIVNSTLIIRESTNKHFGLYRCNVSNEYGSDSLDIYLRAGKNFPLLMILFGVTTGTMMVAGLIILVIICHRKQRNNKQRAKKPDVTVTAEDLFKENDRNSNISDLKMELRGNVSGDVDYSNAGSNSTLCSNAKLGTSVPLSGTIPLSVNQSKNYPYRYNEYTDPALNDYKVNGYSNGFYTYVHYGHDYTPGSLKVQSPNSSEKLTNPSRSINGSLPRSADSLATVQFNGSHSNSLQRPIVKKRLEAPCEGSCEVTRLPNSSVPGIDVRYTTAYGNPHLKGASVIGYAAQVNTAKPASTPAPPPYSSVKNSIILPSGPSSHSVTSPTSLAGSPITSSTISADSNVPQISVATTSATPQSPSTLYILAPPSRAVNNSTITKKGNCHQAPMATHV